MTTRGWCGLLMWFDKAIGRPTRGPGRTSAALVVAVSLALWPAMPQAQEPPSKPTPAAAPPQISATATDTAPTIDGRLDEPLWQRASRVTAFVQQRPLEGAPASERTEVYIAYDSQFLYFGAFAHYSDQGLIRANRVDRDQTENDDTIQLLFDPFLDQQRGYLFSVNGYGVQGDQLLVNQPANTGSNSQSGDRSWDALFFSAGRLVDDGWTVEIAIPFKSLRYPTSRDGAAHRWGFQIQRNIASKDEAVVWAPVSRDVPQVLRQMGVLEGLANLSTRRNLELLPTLTAIQVGNLSRTTGVYATDHVEEGGANVKYGITPNLTFDFTYNPDFSQIESDRPQIEVNQRFPILYPELRPFFLEGQEIFRVNSPVTLIHTRTIVDPQYGAKLTGKVGKTTLGVVVANDEAPGKVDDPNDEAFGQSAVFFLSRLRYDVYKASHVGMLVTNREFLDGYSRLAGVDGSFQLGPSQLARFHVMASDHRDRAGVRRTGHIIDVRARMDGRRFSYTLISSAIDPDFRTDAGFVRRADTWQSSGGVTYRWWPEGWMINWGPRVNYLKNYDYKGVLQDQETTAGLEAQFAKNINANAQVTRELERYAEIDFRKTRVTVGGNVNTSRRISFGGSLNMGDQIRFVAAPFLGSSAELKLNMTVRPFSRLQSQVTLDTSQFVDTRTDTEIFDVKIFRALTTYQVTSRLVVRNIAEYNTLNKTVAANVLITYRVNSGTVFFVGYDDHYRQGDQVDPARFPTDAWQRTNRAIFTKFQYLLRI